MLFESLAWNGRASSFPTIEFTDWLYGALNL